MKKTGIYKITSPTGKVYIGQSIDILNRFSSYRRMKCKNQVKLFSSFKKHGVKKHLFEIIEECPLTILNEREIFYIEKYKSFNNYNGMNLTSGGGANTMISIETKIKISEGNKGKKISDESKLLMSISQKKRGAEISKLMSERNKGNTYSKGRVLSLVHIEKLKSSKIGNPPPMLGKRHSQESIQKMRKTKLGKVVSKETGKKISLANKGRTLSEDQRVPEISFKT